MRHHSALTIWATTIAFVTAALEIVGPSIGPSMLRAQDAASTPLRVGIIGLDTSHVKAFTTLMNSPNRKRPNGEMRVVAAFPGGSPDIVSSASRIEGFTNDLKNMGVEIVGSIDELLTKVDAVLLESVDGRPHLAQALPVMRSGKPMFIDKPLAGSLADAIAIDMLGKKYKSPWFSSSSLRFGPTVYRWREDPALSKSVRGASVWSPCSIEKTHPDLFWYGVHGVEMLYTVMGEGCQQVTRSATDGTDVVVGVWSDGRIGTYRGLRDGKADYGMVVFGATTIEVSEKDVAYQPLVERIEKFFVTRQSPVPTQESLELFAFMEAADESKRTEGRPIKIADVMAKATAEAKLRLAELDK